jgi:hypothetical protein
MIVSLLIARIFHESFERIQLSSFKIFSLLYLIYHGAIAIFIDAAALIAIDFKLPYFSESSV